MRLLALASVCLWAVGTLPVVTGESGRRGPTPDPGENPLTANETATLWSKASRACQIGRDTNDSAMEALTSCTDVTFKEPPRTASTWTNADFGDLTPGNRTAAVYPPTANRTNSRSIADAHVSFFAIQPSTRLHSTPGDGTLYVAPNGTVRGLVDYRVRTPTGDATGNRTVTWSVTDHGVTALRLRADGETIATGEGTQTPMLNYSLSDSGTTTLQLEADIRVHLRKQVTVGTGATTRRWSTERTDTVTVTDSIPVSVYDLTAYRYDATYPNGDTGLSIYQTAPWHGFSLGSTSDARVRGVWRYYTARDTDWDVLNTTTAAGTIQQPSDARPVYVHAFPARVGPRTEPIRGGPTLVDEYGPGHESPAPSLHENVTVGVVATPYNRTNRLVVRHDAIDPADVVVHGIVRNVTATASTFAGRETRSIRRSNLTVDRINRSGASTTLQLELRDARTGDPIVLDEPLLENRSVTPIGIDPRDGYITIADQRVRTNRSGVAIVTLDEPGSYSATYKPESWRSTDPAYVGDTAHIAWHPLWRLSGWLELLYRTIVVFGPFVIALYAGYRLSAYIQINEYQ